MRKSFDLAILNILKHEFFSKIQKTRSCWLWKSSFSGHGYGMFRKSIDNNLYCIGAHRASWIIHHQKKIPDKMLVCHECDNKKCVNPNHLFIGSHQNNSDDKITKNRGINGEKNGRSKLTDIKVKNILSLHPKESIGEISRMFDVDRSTISLIINGKSWQHIKRNKS